MTSDSQVTNNEADLDPEWEARMRDWRRKLGRIRLGVEPIDDQLRRYFRVTLAVTAVAGFLTVFFLALFAAFKRPDVGAVLAIVLLGPIVAMAWLDHARLRWYVRRFEDERRKHELAAVVLREARRRTPPE